MILGDFTMIIALMFLTSLTQNPNQLHVIGLGTFGGLFGAICSQVLVALLYGSDTDPAFSSKVFEMKRKC